MAVSVAMSKIMMMGILLCAPLTVAASATSTPNFIILFADDMGYSEASAVSDRSPFAGINGTVHTPRLDKMASEGVVFTSWYSAFHCCTASRAAMMTGRLSVRTGIGFVGQGSNGVFTSESIGGLPLNETTMAEAVKPVGYMTGAIGKWHLGQQPKYLPPQRGFDFYYGIPFSCDMGLSAWSFANHSEEPFKSRPLPLFNCTTEGEFCDDSKVIEQPTNLATLTMRYATAALEFVATAKAAAKPFLLYIPFNHVHSPNFASEDFCNTSTHGPVGDATQEMDHAIGVIVDGVDALGLDENTVWFFTSDNGAPLANDKKGNGPLRDGKMTTWEGGIREPAFIRWKGDNGFRGGRITDAVVATYDIFATVIALAKAPAPKGVVLDGVDLTATLRDPNAAAPHTCLFHYWSPQLVNDAQFGNTSGVAAVRCGKYKAHYYIRITGPGQHAPTKLKAGPQNPPALFDLDVDISESNPLDLSTPAAQTAMSQINAALTEHLAGVDMVPNQMINNNSCTASLAVSCVGGNDINLAVCKDPSSKSKYPQFPNCTSNPEYYGTAECRAANKQCLAKCMPPPTENGGGGDEPSPIWQ